MSTSTSPRLNGPNRTGVAAARRATELGLDGSGRGGKWKGGAFKALLVLCLLLAFVTLLAVIIQAFVRGCRGWT